MVWQTWLAPGLHGCQALPCTEAAIFCLAEMGHEAAGVGPQGNPELVLTHWWAELGSGVGGCRARVSRYSVSLLVDGAGSGHHQLWILGCPKVVSGFLLSGVGSQGGWLRSPVYLRAFLGLLMGRAGAQNALWLVPACWCMCCVLPS